jgi:hypothetical protein
MSRSAVNAAPPQLRNASSSAPSPVRHGGCTKTATAAPLALSRKRARDLKKRNETESGEIPQLLQALFANRDFAGSANNDHSVTMFIKDR